MPKTTGLGDNFYIGGFDLSSDVSALGTIAHRRAVLDQTGINKSANERALGLQDGEMSFALWKDATTDAEADALEALPTSDRIAMYFNGTAIGNAAAGLFGKQITYDWDRGTDGGLAGSVQVLSNGFAIDWGEQLTVGKQNFASAANGTSIDYGAAFASTAFGAVGYLEVFSMGSGTATVAIQDSADNGTFANIIAFTGATGRTQERVATGVTATIRRYIRVNVTGSFTNAVIAVMFRRFEAAQS